MAVHQLVKDPGTRVPVTLRTCQDQALAVSLARDAGELLVQLQEHAAASHLSGRALKDKGDAMSQEFLDSALRRERPGDAIFSEEAADSPERLSAGRVWIIDPLDGTREFSEGRPDWAVHVALWESGQLVAGAVAVPGEGCMIGDGHRQPIHGGGRRDRLRIAVSRTRPPDCAERLAEYLDAELLPMGSAGYKAWLVTTGEADAYVHAGGQYEWDSAAPVFAAREAGMHASRMNGSALLYNQAVPYLPDLLLCHQDVAALMLHALAWTNHDTD
ncbi:3'(2'),5'-bisphosphate nucleotidase CysQ [Arthrobacter sp. STN4]|uniref:3'(2'),5'-bisphosphate nucleotidase CysQ n=1 Tax=Arthrobacter sp. STN4 TaxID=2923276 RepID=UPI00211A630E|nr:3'(2'),5'-bisphosphate nucleotidase CysQ [Arthrobacter sp. STN4]MCQ9163635.1 3'(2'),5'-bisphosphate nucleotidase CysQ [Arthrobacter sp. STN4]